jgi:hypothetical protein
MAETEKTEAELLAAETPVQRAERELDMAERYGHDAGAARARAALASLRGGEEGTVPVAEQKTPAQQRRQAGRAAAPAERRAPSPGTTAAPPAGGQSAPAEAGTSKLKGKSRG